MTKENAILDNPMVAQRLSAWNDVGGARVGDFVRCLDGTIRRIARRHEQGIQTTLPQHGFGTFFLDYAKVTYSGSKGDAISFTKLLQTEELHEGEFDVIGVKDGKFKTDCRVFIQLE